jgi:DNA-binding NarL/FixJ family response regulator
MARGLLMAGMFNRGTEQGQPPHPLRLTRSDLLSALATGQPLECSFEAGPSQSTVFGPVIGAYAAERGCSPIQRAVLALHFAGLHNKAIADALQVALATVYEHWRRMALKAGCRSQSDVVADVYRYLAVRFTIVERIARPG